MRLLREGRSRAVAIARSAPSHRLLLCFAAAASLAAVVASPAPGQVAGPTPLKVVLIGDSYSAGNGAGDYYGPQGCYRSSSNWAERYLDALRGQGYAITFVNRACSGGVTADVTEDRVDEKSFTTLLPGQWSDDDPRLPDLLRLRGGSDCMKTSAYPEEELFALDVTRTSYDVSIGQTVIDFTCRRTLDSQVDVVGKDTDLVLMTLGGNDARFSDIVKLCFAPVIRDAPDCIERMSDAARMSEDGTMRDRIADVLRALRGRMRPDARIVLNAYPYLEYGTDYSIGIPPFFAGLAIRALGDLGDAAQRAAVDGVNAEPGDFAQSVFVPQIKACFAGHEPFGAVLSQNPDRWIYEFEQLPIEENYHPNPEGHQGWADCLIPFGAFGVGGSPGVGGSVDIVFTIDTTGSMGDDIDAVKAFAAELVTLVSARVTSARFALVTYRDHPSRTGDPSDYPARVDLDFTDDASTIVSAVTSLSVDGGGDTPETVYSGLLQAIGLSWRPGVKKIVLQLGDAPPLDPEPVTNYTADDVVEAALAVDPAEVYALDVSSGGAPAPTLVDIATRTGGGVFTATSPSEVAGRLVEIIEAALAKPFAWAGGPYVARVGEPVTLDGSGSVDGDGTIVSYEWDVDGDGDYDTSSSSPTRTTTFAAPFDGFVALRVTDDDGRTTVATARAHASADGDEVPSELDNCPSDPNHGQADFDGDGVGDVCDPDPGFVLEGGQLECGGLTPTIVGTDGPDNIVGTAGVDVIAGLGGDDVISANAGNDVVCGGGGADRLIGAGGADRLMGEEGADVLDGGDGNDTLEGGSGTDRLVGGKDDDTLRGGADNDTLDGGAGRDGLDGGPGTDSLNGGAGSDTCTTGETLSACEG